MDAVRQPLTIIGSSVLAPDPAVTSRILNWYACQDVDQSSLVSMQESSDWQDLFCTRGKGLYVNCLYVLALRAAGRSELASRVAEKINACFWYRGDSNVLLAPPGQVSLRVGLLLVVQHAGIP